MNRDVPPDYRDGWKQGYLDLSRGQCDELPALPPQKYWSAFYQTPEGQVCIEQWYQGWRDGADAAKACGAPEWHRIAPAPTAPSMPEHAELTRTATHRPATVGEPQLARRPAAPNLPVPQSPVWNQTPAQPLPNDIAPPDPSVEPEEEAEVRVRPVTVDLSELNEDLQENYAVPLSAPAELPVGAGVEGE
jgi:hypothetical protein